jgi:chromatin segregation and condensation protein Rec8/ScpA/Scc1 (kleisin family)
MSDEIEIRDNEEEIVNEDNIIELTDEDGETVQFEFCASIEYEGKEYVVLLPMDEDDGEVVILEVKEDEEDSEEEEDPREELVRRLLEYKMYKYLSGELEACREQAGVRYYRTQDLPKEVRSYQPPINYEELLGNTDLKSLEKVFGEVLRRKKSRRDPIRSGFGKIKREEVNIDNKTLYIRAYLQAHPQTDFRALLESQESKEEVIVTFLILLELMKHQKVHIVQDSICGRILIDASASAEDPVPPAASAEEEDSDTIAADDTIPAEEADPDTIAADDTDSGSPAVSADAGPADQDFEHEDSAYAAPEPPETDFIAPPEETSPREEEQLPVWMPEVPVGTSPREGEEQILPEYEDKGSSALLLSVRNRMELVSPVSVSGAFSLPTREPAVVHEDLPSADGTVFPAEAETVPEVISASENTDILTAEESIPGDPQDPIADESALASTRIPEPEQQDADFLSWEKEPSISCFRIHLWQRILPGHISSHYDLKAGHIRSSRISRSSAASPIRRSDPLWEQARLSRLWTRRM